MVASITSDKKLNNLITLLRQDYADVTFKKSDQDYWSPRTKTVYYSHSATTLKSGYSLLHELAHALLKHKDYASDFELLIMETQAWELAAKLGKKYGVNINQAHIEKCLDTYRNWLFRRSLCPSCGSQAIQVDSKSYKCHNCQTSWKVTPSRFNRPYRQVNR